MFNKINLFLKDSYREFKRVNWPSREDTIKFTIVVLVISLAMAAFLGALDYMFVGFLEELIL